MERRDVITTKGIVKFEAAREITTKLVGLSALAGLKYAMRYNLIEGYTMVSFSNMHELVPMVREAIKNASKVNEDVVIFPSGKTVIFNTTNQDEYSTSIETLFQNYGVDDFKYSIDMPNSELIEELIGAAKYALETGLMEEPSTTGSLAAAIGEEIFFDLMR